MQRGRKMRKGKAKPKKMRQKHEMDEQSLSDIMKRRKFVIIGSGEHIPQWRFKRAYLFNSSIVLGGSFTTKVGLTGNTIAGAASAYGGAMAFGIQDLPDISSYTALFDQFIITRIVLRVKALQVIGGGGGGASTTGANVLYVVIDYDNNTALASRAAALVYNPVQEVRTSGAGFGESLTIDFVPALSIPGVLGNSIVGPRWQDVAVQGNKHSGVKFWYQTGATTDPQYDIEAQYHYGFANFQ